MNGLLRMMRIVAVIAAGAPVHTLPVRTAAAETVESAAAYEIAAELAVSILPPDLRPMFEGRLSTVQDGATSVLVTESSSGTGGGKFQRHYVLLDIDAEEEDWASRRAAAARFPRDRSGVERLAAADGVQACGSLPWVIASKYRELVGVFNTQDVERIARESGVLVHFATDAALPFNSTTFGHPAAGRSGDFDNAPQAFHVELVGALHDSLENEARVWSGRCWPTADVMGRVFDTLLSSHDAAETLVQIAQRTRREGKGRRGSSERLTELAERAAPILESRLEEGALLGAVLITSAWIEAGRPALSAPVREADAQAGAEAATNGEQALVGSLHSTVVHLATCAHAKRINAENRVFFPTTSAAQSAGRRGCKSCDPYTPSE